MLLYVVVVDWSSTMSKEEIRSEGDLTRLVCVQPRITINIHSSLVAPRYATLVILAMSFYFRGSFSKKISSKYCISSLKYTKVHDGSCCAFRWPETDYLCPVLTVPLHLDLPPRGLGGTDGSDITGFHSWIEVRRTRNFWGLLLGGLGRLCSRETSIVVRFERA